MVSLTHTSGDLTRRFSESDVARSVLGLTLFSVAKVDCATALPCNNEALLAADILANIAVSCPSFKRLPQGRELFERLRGTLEGLGFEIPSSDPNQKQDIAELITLGNEILLRGGLLRTEILVQMYEKRITAMIRRLLQHQPVHDSGWAPPPEIEGSMESIRHFDDETKSRLWTLLMEANSRCAGFRGN